MNYFLHLIELFQYVISKRPHEQSMSYKNDLILNVMFDFESYPVGVLMTGPLCRVAVASDWTAVNTPFWTKSTLSPGPLLPGPFSEITNLSYLVTNHYVVKPKTKSFIYNCCPCLSLTPAQPSFPTFYTLTPAPSRSLHT